MIWILLAIAFMALSTLGLMALCRAIAPKTAEEWRVADEEQMVAVCEPSAYGPKEPA